MMVQMIFFVQAPSGGDLENLLPENVKYNEIINDVVGTFTGGRNNGCR